MRPAILSFLNKKTLSIFFGLVFIVIIEWWLGWRQVILPWKQLSVGSVFIAVFLIFLTYQIRTLRVYDYFRKDLKGHWWSTMRLSLLHNALNNILPMRSGEASFPILMQRYFGISLRRSLPALLWLRLLDLLMLVTVSAVVILFAKLHLALYFILIIVLICSPYGLYLFRTSLMESLYGKEGGKKWFYDLLSGLPNSNLQFMKSWGLTCLNWVLKLLVLVWVLGEFLPLNTTILFSSVVAGELTTILPFHAPGGIGKYEAGAAAPLLGLADVKIVMPAVINLHLFFLSVSVIGGGLAWFIPAPYDVASDKI